MTDYRQNPNHPANVRDRIQNDRAHQEALKNKEEALKRAIENLKKMREEKRNR